MEKINDKLNGNYIVVSKSYNNLLTKAMIDKINGIISPIPNIGS